MSFLYFHRVLGQSLIIPEIFCGANYTKPHSKFLLSQYSEVQSLALPGFLVEREARRHKKDNVKFDHSHK